MCGRIDKTLVVADAVNVAQTQAQETDDSRVPWPIVRARRTGCFTGNKQVVRLDPDRICIFTTPKPLTDELLNRTEANASLQSYCRIDRAKIWSVRLKRSGFLLVPTLSSRFQIETAIATKTFLVSDRETPHVVRAIQQIAGERFHEPQVPRSEPFFLSAGEWFLLTLAITCLMLIVVGLSNGSDGQALGAIGFVVMTPAVPALVWDRRRREHLYKIEAVRPRHAYPRLSSLKRPFRSPTVGWLLRTIGLVLVALGIGYRYAAPAHDPVLEYLSGMSGVVAIIIGNRLCARIFEPTQHPDPRAPVLFLRSFDDDGKRTFQPTSVLARIHGVVDPMRLVSYLHPVSLVRLFLNVDSYGVEELLASTFRPCGPLIAIGQPGEILATSGADRMYVGEEVWQKVVLGYLERSQAVILQPAETDGVRWEMQAAFRRVPRHRLLLSMLNFCNRPTLYEDFREWLKEEHGVRLPLVLPCESTPSIVYFEPDGVVRCQLVCFRSPLLWTFLANAVDGRQTFRAFLNGLEGGPREPPKEPKRYPGHAALSVVLLAAVYFGLGWCAEAIIKQKFG